AAGALPERRAHGAGQHAGDGPRGGGVRMRVAVLMGSSAFVLAGCGHQTSSLREHAAHDLRGPNDEVRLLEKHREVRDVEGCGKRATYAWTGRTWVLQSPPSTGQQPPPVLVYQSPPPGVQPQYGQPQPQPQPQPQYLQQQPTPQAGAQPVQMQPV